MRRLGKAVAGLEEPAVEKIAQDQKENAFQVLIATMLSAQTRDAVTHAASSRLFKVARTPRTLGRLPVDEIERLIYPVSFYRHKAVHVKATCEQLLTRFAGRVPDTMASLLTLPGVGRKTANLVLIIAHRSADTADGTRSDPTSPYTGSRAATTSAAPSGRAPARSRRASG